jgi:hypothetical protein
MKLITLQFLATLVAISCNTQPKNQNTNLLSDNEKIRLNETHITSPEEPIYSSQDTTPFITASYGIGKVKIVYEFALSENKPYSYEILSDPNNHCTKTKVELIWNESNNGYVEAVNDEIVKIRDYHIGEPYYIILFDCLRIQNEFCEIIVNEQTKEKKWIKLSETIRFEPWEVFLKNVVCVSQIDFYSNPVRIEPNESSNILLGQGTQCWAVEEMRGNWIKIKYSEIDLNPEDKELARFRGWIKWRDNNDFLIKYFLAV